MNKITNLNSSSINSDFTISDMLGSFDVASFSFNKQVMFAMDEKKHCRVEYEPVKMMVTKADTILTDEVIDKLISAPKYIVRDMQTTTTNPTYQKVENNIKFCHMCPGINVEPDYYDVEETKDGYNEYYEKQDTALTNGGVFFMVSEIDDNIHLFTLNVLESGSTGKSVALTYLPNGKMENAVMLERFCYHGVQGNEHKNTDGTIIARRDLHIHRTSEKFMDSIISSKLDEEEKAIKLNSPEAFILKRSVYSGDANIRKLVEYAMVGMNIQDNILENITSDNDFTITDSIKYAIDNNYPTDTFDDDFVM